MTERDRLSQGTADHYMILAQLGRTAETAGDYKKAEEYYKKTLGINHGAFETAIDLGNLYTRQGRCKEAIIVYRYILSAGMERPDLLNNLACALKEEGLPGEAEAHFRRAILLQPQFVEAMNNLGVLLREQGRLDEALSVYEKALALRPDAPVIVDNLGSVCMERGEYGKAEAHFRRALSLDPSFHQAGFDLAYVLLLKGNYRDGFEKYELRLEREGAAYLRPRAAPRLAPARKGATVLIRAEQGLGDTVHFARLLAPLKEETAGRVILECQPQLLDLLRTIDGADEVVPQRTDHAPANVEHDAEIPLLSLPYFLGLSAHTIPAPVPYIHIDEGPAARWRERLLAEGKPESLKIGIAWAGNAKNTGDRSRSIGFQQFLPLLGAAFCDFYSLQYGRDALAEVGNTSGTVRLHIMTKDIKAFTETAALIKNLDLVITVDSVIGHLAGALGAPVWNLLPYVPDWRWGLEGERTPWYPTMRLFRQRYPGDWRETINRVFRELAALSAEKAEIIR
ncbi:MAG: tetratricopeptide repeat protein [Syntrophorhabdaceae bacterium]|nr:tetratricopeptide repeat protein [Syntrophorhabdaceae bacterium]